MASIPRTTPDPVVISAKSRQSFISAIPRPTSGSSRLATPTAGRPATTTVRQGTESLQPGQKPRTSSWQSNDGAPPSAFYKSHSRFTKSDFLLPYHQRRRKDLSGIQQQLHIRSWSTKSLVDPTSPKSPPQPVQSPRVGGLVKSRTTNDLLSSPRDITPRRRLLQPLEPPLPRTQTLGNISCFGPTNLTPSPRKPSSITASQAYGYHDNTSQLSVGDALGESRMTAEEVEFMKQVQREAAVNRIRLRNALQGSSRRTSSNSLPPPVTAPIMKGEPLPISTLADNATVPRPSAAIQRKSAPGRQIFIDSALANKAAIDSDSLSPRTPPSTVGSNSGSLPADTSKHVYFAESLQYWTGRYVSLCDRIRNQEMQHAEPLNTKDADNGRLDELFDNTEKVRMYAALNNLRKDCKTAIAVGSFEEFETGLLGKSENSRSGHRRRPSHIVGRVQSIGRMKAPGSGSVRPPLSWGMSQSPGNISSRTNAEAVMSSSSDAFYGVGSLPKSKTTGNLASFIPVTVKKQTARATNSSAKLSTTVAPIHRTTTSYLCSSPELRDKVLKDREERAARRAADAHRHSSSRFPSQSADTNGDQTRMHLQSLKTSVPLGKEQTKVSQTQASTLDDVVEPLDRATRESGHGVQPLMHVERAQNSSQVQIVNVSGGGVEKVIKSRRKTERQSGGEMVKSLFGVGMREVKKMSRRVGSWAGSSDDLSLGQK
ncbi:hypothetical protein LTR10_019635 [Elasticomyces elasticus]|uniref:Uncharacterized protein n=1 Tax=Exophiala sideris TaxID=1016849 RepID=A0ABR0JFL2_9EURO|nr:hypothetical protein LTR10_019635 [Elasticomyces elasticus]KAK5025789.1 hypothetical protein LTS07_007993 [Exophiala sideris]KAK5033003.1 hypothetical protein LTR13_006968 [Exophiala sideris]KAK5063488.1 hypothetical protein LTR69_004194 [Exophiala sideris]KAK5180680.1 hypothetical protein LTR44_006994 [Eurotiomycetes sp. CCFEE 6388]